MKQTLYTNCKGKITNNGTCDTCGQKASSSNSNCWKMIPIDNLSNSASNELASYKAELRELLIGTQNKCKTFQEVLFFDGVLALMDSLEDNPTEK